MSSMPEEGVPYGTKKNACFRRFILKIMNRIAVFISNQCFLKTVLILILYTGEDEEAWTFNEIAANWAVEDLESGIKTCQWAIGKYMSYN